jgi:hypothetical protein
LSDIFYEELLYRLAKVKTTSRMGLMELLCLMEGLPSSTNRLHFLFPHGQQFPQASNLFGFLLAEVV